MTDIFRHIASILAYFHRRLRLSYSKTLNSKKKTDKNRLSFSFLSLVSFSGLGLQEGGSFVPQRIRPPTIKVVQLYYMVAIQQPYSSDRLSDGTATRARKKFHFETRGVMW